MKKLYTLALAAVVSLSAAAVRPIQPTDKLNYPVKPSYELNFSQMETVKAPTSGVMHKKSASRADEVTINDLVGDYIWSYYTLLGNGGEKSADITIELVDEDTGDVVITGFPQNFKIKGYFDLEKMTLNLTNKQLVGKDSDGDIYFYGKQMTASGEGDDASLTMSDGAIKDEYIVGKIEDNIIAFDEMIAWALGDPNDEKLGWYLLCAANDFEKSLTWYNIGTAKFLENILYSTATGKENTQVSNVTIQACEEYENVFRVLDPLVATYKALKINSTSPAFTLDCSVANDVLMSYTDSGLQTQTLGELYYTNQAMFYMSYGVETAPEFATVMTVEGNNYTITFPKKAILIVPETPVSDEELMYASQYESTLSFTYDAAGLSNVTVDDENAPVEYFNLQGIRVANPEAGIYIRRQGNNTTKVKL